MDLSTNSIIIYAIVIAMLGIVAALIFVPDFRKDMRASEGEASIAGMSVKGMAPIVLLGLCLIFLFLFKDDNPEITTEAAINQLSKDSEDAYSTTTASNDKKVSLLAKKNGSSGEGSIIGEIDLPAPEKVTEFREKELSLGEMYDMAIFYNKSKKAKSGEYIFKLFNVHGNKLNELDEGRQESLGLAIMQLGQTYYMNAEKVDSLVKFIGSLNNLTPKFKTLRQAEIYYGAGIPAKNDNWKLSGLQKYFAQHDYANLPKQSKIEARNLFRA